jgi:murein DD-endopeptidase MepM/ murein hydrolase activator NlpD
MRWSAGHRGVDLVAFLGQPVRAPAAGRVLFAGTVVDRGVLTLLHGGGVRTTYEPVVATVSVGDLVTPGQQVALLAGTPGHCAPGTCLHWGARRFETYLDPLSLLRPPDPAVLLPLRGHQRPI